MTSKKEVTSALLLKTSVFVHFNAAVKGVATPPNLVGLEAVVFQIGLHMPVPIPDLKLDHQGFEGTLSFRGTACFCRVPWEAVYAVVGEDGKGMVWEEDMPESVKREAERPTLRGMPTNKNPKPSPIRRPPPKLKTIK